MPILETEVKSSWADEVEEGDFTELPPQSVTFDNGVRKIVEYKRNDEGKKVKVERQYKVETKKVQKSVAKRRTLKKFGMSKDDGPGPDPATTIAAEEVFMQFVTSKDYDEQQNDDALSKIRQHGMVKCRLCRGDHWTSSCPYKDKLGEIPTGAAGAKPRDEKLPPGPEDKLKPAKYVPPSKRGDGAAKPGESMSFPKQGRQRMPDYPCHQLVGKHEGKRFAGTFQEFRKHSAHLSWKRQKLRGVEGIRFHQLFPQRRRC
jgi:translation initiation factor 3 subunit G